MKTISIGLSLLGSFAFLFAWIVVVIAGFMAWRDGLTAQALWLGAAAALQLFSVGLMLIKKLLK